jgi:hypothetical protein
MILHELLSSGKAHHRHIRCDPDPDERYLGPRELSALGFSSRLVLTLLGPHSARTRGEIEDRLKMLPDGWGDLQ